MACGDGRGGAWLDRLETVRRPFQNSGIKREVFDGDGFVHSKEFVKGYYRLDDEELDELLRIVEWALHRNAVLATDPVPGRKKLRAILRGGNQPLLVYVVIHNGRCEKFWVEPADLL